PLSIGSRPIPSRWWQPSRSISIFSGKKARKNATTEAESIILIQNSSYMSQSFLTQSQAIQITVFLLRTVSGLLFLQAGGMKLFGWFGGMPGGESLELLSQTGIGGILEFFGASP